MDRPFHVFDCCGIAVTLLTALFVVTALSTIVIGGFPFMSQALSSPETLFSLRLSLATSTLSTLLCFAVGIPCAYALVRCRFPFKRLCAAVTELPLSMPYMVLGLCLLMVFSSDLGRWLRDAGFRIVFDAKGIVAAQWMVNIPFMIQMLRTSFEGADPRLEFIAATLGASRWQRFKTVLLPQCINPMLMAGILVWSRAMGEFGATLMLVGVTRLKTETLPASIYLNITTGDDGMAMASAILLLAISGTTQSLASLLRRRAPSRVTSAV